MILRVLQNWFKQQPFTVVALTFSILFPVLGLVWSRYSLQQNRVLQGIPFQLVRQSRLIQSFVVDPEQSVPAIWSRRLGDDDASIRWAASARKLWWMVWLEDGEPLLLISATRHSSPTTFHFADALHRAAHLGSIELVDFDALLLVLDVHVAPVACVAVVPLLVI